jgi:hypothetical protein
MSEKERLERIAKNSIYSKGVAVICQEYCCEIFMRHLLPGSILELGPAEGVMTNILYQSHSENYTVVDGSEIFISQIKKRYPNINAIVSIFEEFNPETMLPPPPRVYITEQYWRRLYV